MFRCLVFSLLLAAAPATSQTKDASACDSASGLCCCTMSNGLQCCGSSVNCGSGAVSGCPCGGLKITG